METLWTGMGICVLNHLKNQEYFIQGKGMLLVHLLTIFVQELYKAVVDYMFWRDQWIFDVHEGCVGLQGGGKWWCLGVSMLKLMAWFLCFVFLKSKLVEFLSYFEARKDHYNSKGLPLSLACFRLLARIHFSISFSENTFIKLLVRMHSSKESWIVLQYFLFILSLLVVVLPECLSWLLLLGLIEVLAGILQKRK